ncbi:MAG: hypothetical protein QW279_00950, partial [Candidatus Jordarchaeaceae archaeon]
MKRRIMAAVAVATLTLFILVIALPVFTPVMAVSAPIVDDDQSTQTTMETLTLSDALPYLGNRGFNFS